MRFAEFHAGQVIEAGPYSVSESEVVQFAFAYDPQWFHTHADAASRGRFQGLIASGRHTCGMAMRLVADAALHGSESFASPGLAYVKWPQNGGAIALGRPLDASGARLATTAMNQLQKRRSRLRVHRDAEQPGQAGCAG